MKNKIKAIALVITILSGTLIFLSFTNNQKQNTMSNKIITAITQFKLVKGMDDKKFLEASDEAQKSFFEKADGFIDRELAKGENGHWVDITHWENLEKAQNAEKTLGANPEGLKLIMACDSTTFQLVNAEQKRVHKSKK